MSKKEPQIQILDCSVRDGGYLNDWHFEPKMVKELYRNLARTGIDFVEIGFRNLPKKDMGLWFSVSEKLVKELFSGFSGINLALMVDFGKFSIDDIPPADSSLIKLYRLACHRDKILEGIEACSEIKDKGYLVSIQLMDISGYSLDELKSLTGPLAKSNIDYVYFADSYGSLFPQDIKKYIEILKPTRKKIGFHAHNNLQFAFANTLTAIASGVDIIDGTVYGIGRGAGNLPLEVLIMYFEKTLASKRYNSMPVLDLIDRYFITLHKQLKWGYNLAYMLSGVLEVHPNYAKYLSDYHEYNIDDMVKVLEAIKCFKPVGFKPDLLTRVINSGFVGGSRARISEEENSEEILTEVSGLKPVAYSNRHAGRDFLVFGNGPTLKEHKSDIDAFIERYNPVILGANYMGGLFKPDYHAFSNKKRFIDYVDSVDAGSCLLLSSAFDKDFIQVYTDRAYERLAHCNRVSAVFDIHDGVVTSNCRTITILLVAVAIVMGAKRIFIAGLDGYKNNDEMLFRNIHFYQEPQEAETFKLLMEKHNWNETMLNGINSYLNERNQEGLHIITPTSHKYFYSSIYNWIKDK